MASPARKAAKAAKLARKQRRRERLQFDRLAEVLTGEVAAAGDNKGPPLAVIEGGKQPIRIPAEVLAKSRLKPSQVSHKQIFAIPRPPPGVVPEGLEPSKNPVLAMDEQGQELSSWAAGTYASGWFDGPLFMGYPALSLLAVLPEYRRMAEVLATECTRRWIRFGAKDSDNTEKLDKVTALQTEHDRLDIRGAMRRLVELDAFFGRSHLFVDVGTDPDDRAELEKSIGNGRNDATLAKFQGQRDFLRGVKPIEPVWCYPAYYNATNPLKDNWYAPQLWYCQAQSIHVTRLLRFVGREVPDLLKPAYMFGGVSLSQLMKPYVDRWITTVQAVVDIVVSFSTSGIKTNLETLLKPTGGSPDIFARVELFNNLRSNRGAMLLDMETEEFFQFNVPLSELESLMSKMQEFLCSMSGEPVVKLLGIQPAGLNASSQGEITSWLDWCEAYREKFCAPHLTTIVDFMQLSLFGEIDPDITWSWENLRSLDPKEETERRKVQAETDGAYVEMGVFDPREIRQGVLADPESPYFGLEELTPEELAEGVIAGGGVDPGMAAEFPQLEAPGAAPLDPNGQEDPRTAGRRGAGPQARPARLPRAEANPERAARVTPARAARAEGEARPGRTEQRQRSRVEEPAE